MKWCVRASSALFGVAIAIGMAPALQSRARPEALPGSMAAGGLSATSPLLQFALVIVLPFAAALAGERVIGIVLEKRWTAIAYSVALASAPITLMHFGSVRHVVLHGVVAAGVVLARRLEPRFSRADIVLLPALLSCTFLFYDLGFGRTPAATFLRAAIAVFALRLAVGFLSRGDRPGLAFCAAPLALVFQMQWLDPATASMIAIPILFLTPVALALLTDQRRLSVFAAYVAYPIIVTAYPLTLIGIVSPPHVDFFEDGHNVLPAAEMMRGERPYRDIVPAHGLISDGGIDLLAMKLGARTLGSVLATRRAVSALNLTSIYFVGLAATGSADLALLASFLGIALFPAETVWMRTAGALAALAAVVAGTRLRSRAWFIAAGALLVLAFLVSIDFAIYSAVVVLFAAIRTRMLVPLLVGIVSAAVPVVAVFAAFGFAAGFFRVTFGEILPAGPVYIVGPLDVPDCLRSLTGLVVNLDNPECFSQLVWLAALVGAAVVVARRPLRAHRRDAFWLVALWIVIAGAAYVVRRHFYFTFVIAPFLVAALRSISRRQRTATIALAIVIAFLARPFSHVFDVATALRRSGGIPAANLVPFDRVERARGALFDPATAASLASFNSFVKHSLRPGETFYDFANAGLLYFLFDRDCPIRHVEVPLYETADGQREVIGVLERNRRVRAALIAFPPALSAIDGVPNSERAPLVYRYLQTHFAPAFDENGVTIWIRATAGGRNAPASR